MDASTEVGSDFSDPLLDTYHCGGASDYSDDYLHHNKSTKPQSVETRFPGVI